jgi:hypothetical protein
MVTYTKIACSSLASFCKNALMLGHKTRSCSQSYYVIRVFGVSCICVGGSGALL